MPQLGAGGDHLWEELVENEADIGRAHRVEIEREEDGRWLAEVVDVPGAIAYGATEDDALARVQALALRVLADRLEHGEARSGP